MAQKKTRTTTQTLALIYTLSALIALVSAPDPLLFGLSLGAPLWTHLSYLFIHGSLFHFASNALALLSIAFLWRPSPAIFSTAFILATTLPPIPHTTIIGASGVVYALFGLRFFYLSLPLRITTITTILLGFLIPSLSGWAHLYCFATGLLTAFFITPRYDRLFFARH